MSMQICVLTDSRLDSIAEWQKSVDAEGFPLQLSDAEPSRNLAARLRDEKTSIEYGIYDFSELRDTYKQVNFGRDWKHVIAFTWSSDFTEEIASWMAAIAYARAADGIVFDEQKAQLIELDEAIKMVRDIEHDRPEMEAALRTFMQGVQRNRR